MNFNLSEDQKMIQDLIRDFAQNEIAPQARESEANATFPRVLIKKLGELGLLGMTVDPEFGGMETDYLSLIITIEEISRAHPAIAVLVSVHCSLFCYAIGKYGTDDQKARYLPAAARGDIFGAFSLTEPGAGSDVMSLKTKAVRKGDAFVLNGTKNWVSGGGEAAAVIVFAQTDTIPGKKMLSAFIVDKDTPGFHVAKIEEKMGLHASLTAEINLEDCRVPKENLLGAEGKGASIAFKCLDGSRIGIAAQSVGLAQKALEEAVAYTHQREAFQKKIAEFQAIQFMLADMAVLVDASRLLTYRAANLYDRGLPYAKESAMAKLFASEAANKVAYQALQIHGGYGYSREFLIEQLYRDARVLSIYEGTSEIQRLVISRYLLQE